jgi:hypothetical protein
MLIVLTAEIAAGVWTYQNSDKLEAFVKSNFKHTITNEYKVIDSRTEIVDVIQNHLQCCGVDGPSDWSHSRYNGPKSGSITDLAISASKLAYAVPPSCKSAPLKIHKHKLFTFLFSRAGCKNGTEKSLCETSRKGAITTSLNPVIYNKVSTTVA